MSTCILVDVVVQYRVRRTFSWLRPVKTKDEFCEQGKYYKVDAKLSQPITLCLAPSATINGNWIPARWPARLAHSATVRF